MYVSICRLELYLPGVKSLKEKRQIVKSIVNKVKNRNISIAETGENDLHQKAMLGFTLVSNSRDRAEETTRAILDFIEDNYSVEIVNAEMEIV